LQRLRFFLDTDRTQYVAGQGQVGRQLHELATHQDGSQCQRLCRRHREKLITAPLGNSVLPGITRDSVQQIARDLGITTVEQMIPREMLYIADEAFFTGTAAEVTPIRSVDKIDVGKGAIGPITKAIQKEFYAIVRGEKSDRHGWLTPVPVRSKQPVERVRVPTAV